MDIKQVKEVLLWIWQFPQNLLGLLVCWIYTAGAEHVTYQYGDDGIEYIYSSNMSGGISLGKYIVLPFKYALLKNNLYVQNTHQHEWGHTRQSLYLGWLYLLVIGLPSICWAGLHTYCDKFSKVSYYSFYTEAWADRLGGVER